MDRAPKQCVRIFKGHEGPVYCAAFEGSHLPTTCIICLATGAYLLTGGQDKEVSLFNVHSGSLISTFSGCGYTVNDLSISPGGGTFLTGAGRTLHLWDTAGQRILRRFTGHQERINAVAYGAGDSIAASASYDRTVRLWDVRGSGRFPLMVLEEARDSVTALHLHRHFILTGSVDGYVRCYDIRKGALKIDHVQHPITTVRFTEDCLAYIATSLDSTIRLFDMSSGIVLNSYVGHTNSSHPIRATLFAEDALIAAGSEDGALHIWDLLTAKPVSVLSDHRQSLTFVIPHPKLDSLLTGSLDGTVRLWS